ncbi:hypothetical protein M436DRAFT_68219 [Aureobasidium namibiae CBS 147.97]|uniref:Uncharacterized protein n=1 Tax=Aureobasidium namibiae CBS 147.97 TaxID=1043004 RepID=A0A074X126_9PEZI|nr:uncharacterized protein M436DRAFT_68219 [Aureobasidium namibiae CBS 147.97]KEQ68356.1 hypothetical protein M436DRAFT_68219 [Aureobasidium namibiae CBS 147.97]
MLATTRESMSARHIVSLSLCLSIIATAIGVAFWAALEFQAPKVLHASKFLVLILLLQTLASLVLYLHSRATDSENGSLWNIHADATLLQYRNASVGSSFWFRNLAQVVCQVQALRSQSYCREHDDGWRETLWIQNGEYKLLSEAPLTEEVATTFESELKSSRFCKIQDREFNGKMDVNVAIFQDICFLLHDQVFQEEHQTLAHILEADLRLNPRAISRTLQHLSTTTSECKTWRHCSNLAVCLRTRLRAEREAAIQNDMGSVPPGFPQMAADEQRIRTFTAPYIRPGPYGVAPQPHLVKHWLSQWTKFSGDTPLVVAHQKNPGREDKAAYAQAGAYLPDAKLPSAKQPDEESREALLELGFLSEELRQAHVDLTVAQNRRTSNHNTLKKCAPLLKDGRCQCLVLWSSRTIEARKHRLPQYHSAGIYDPCDFWRLVLWQVVRCTMRCPGPSSSLRREIQPAKVLNKLSKILVAYVLVFAYFFAKIQHSRRIIQTKGTVSGKLRVTWSTSGVKVSTSAVIDNSSAASKKSLPATRHMTKEESKKKTMNTGNTPVQRVTRSMTRIANSTGNRKITVNPIKKF